MKWIAAAIILVGVVLAGTYGLLRTGSGTSTNETGDLFLHFGDLSIPITDDDQVAGSPPVFLGRMVNPEPAFNLAPLGEDLTLIAGVPDRTVLDAMDDDQNLFGWSGRAVYLGDDVVESPVYIFQQTGPSIVDLIKGVFTDRETTGIYGSSYSCCRSQSAVGSPPVNNQPFVGFTPEGGETYATAEMWAVDAEVSVIAFLDQNNQPIGWQRPVSKYVGIRLTAAPGATGSPNIRMVAYNANGETVESASWIPKPISDSFSG